MAHSTGRKASRLRPRGSRADASAPIKERISELAWTGHDAEAIEQASAALAKSDLSVASRLELLDLRAESFVAQGDLERAGADADAMLLNTYYELMFDAISGHGGVVTLMMGDGLMSVFGAPVPLVDHGESAVRSAQEMVELVDLFNVERKAAGKPPIKIGIGIATGEMVAGYTGTNKRATYTCIGDTVNLAARLETHTKVAQRVILIDQATRSSLSERIAVEPLGPVPFKGKASAVEVFAVDPAHR
jgi:class 3 adenylate cyclase